MAQYQVIAIKFSPSWSKVWKENASKMPDLVKDLLTRIGIMGTSYGKKLTPVDSGNLRKRFNYTMVGAKELHIGANVSYAPYILLKTPPYIIKVKNKKALAWTSRGHVRPGSAGAWKGARDRGWAAYAKQVRHPGGKDVLGQTNTYLNEQIPGVVRQVLNKYGIV